MSHVAGIFFFLKEHGEKIAISRGKERSQEGYQVEVEKLRGAVGAAYSKVSNDCIKHGTDDNDRRVHDCLCYVVGRDPIHLTCVFS